MIAILTIGTIAFFQIKPNNENNLASGDYFPIPSIGTNETYEKYRQGFKTYRSEFGYSFEYPLHLKVFTSDRWTILAPIDAEKSTDSPQVIISLGWNDEQMTAEEWLLSSNSGYMQSKDEYGDYYKMTIDGQEAVYTEGGMWVVVNAPDNSYRLSIADLPGKDGVRLFTEMGNVIESLEFSQ